MYACCAQRHIPNRVQLLPLPHQACRGHNGNRGITVASVVCCLLLCGEPNRWEGHPVPRDIPGHPPKGEPESTRQGERPWGHPVCGAAGSAQALAVIHTVSPSGRTDPHHYRGQKYTAIRGLWAGREDIPQVREPRWDILPGAGALDAWQGTSSKAGAPPAPDADHHSDIPDPTGAGSTGSAHRVASRPPQGGTGSTWPRRNAKGLAAGLPQALTAALWVMVSGCRRGSGIERRSTSLPAGADGGNARFPP